MSKIDEIIEAGFEQVSRKYRTLARLPPGKTGLEALAEVDPGLARNFLDQANEAAARHYRAMYAKRENKIVLSIEEFKEYLLKTGRAPVLNEVEPTPHE